MANIGSSNGPTSGSAAMGDAPESGYHAILYTVLFTWIAAKATFWLGSMQESECPTRIVVLLGVSFAVVMGVVITHSLLYASNFDSKLISMKYERERRIMRKNAWEVQQALRRLIKVLYIVMFLVGLAAASILPIGGMPKTVPEDGNISCQAGWIVLWVDVVVVLAAAVTFLIGALQHIDSVQAFFDARGMCGTVAEEYARSRPVRDPVELVLTEDAVRRDLERRASKRASASVDLSQ